MPSITTTPLATGTPTQLPASISVDLIADRRGDNNDGTFTTVVSALVADIRGNPTGDGTVVVFSLSQPVSGVTITQNGRTNLPPDCDVSSYVADTGRPVNPRPGTALACLQYVRSREGQQVTVSARTIGIGGVLLGQQMVRLPTAPPPTATFTETATETPTIGSPTMTGTVTQTPTVTETRTLGPSPTPTETPDEPLRLAAIAGAARPGGTADLRFDLADEEGKVYGLSFDILVDVAVFDLFTIGSQCRPDPTLTTHALSVSLQLDPFVPVGKRRFRFVMIGAIGEDVQLRAGPLVSCSLPVADSAPLGASPIILDRLLAGDKNGMLIPGIFPVNGTLIIDPDAPLPTSTATRTDTPTITVTPTASATRTSTATATASASATPSATATLTPTATDTPIPTDTPTPTATATSTPSASPSITPTPSPLPTATATPPACAGDCDGNGEVSISELILAVNISVAGTSLDECRAVDRDGSGAVTIDELIVAVRNALNGCP
jgi:hypothetical protein